MGLQKGQSNNLNGRPKGVQNKDLQDARVFIKKFISEFNKGDFAKVFKKLPERDKMKVYLDLMQYVTPKLQSVSNEITGFFDINWNEQKTYEAKPEADESIRLS